MNQVKIQFHKTPYGEFILGSFKNKLCLLDYRYRKMRSAIDSRILKGLGAQFVEEDDNLLRFTRIQLEEYFLKKRQVFDIPVYMVGTSFQQLVWQALLNIPYGATATYLQLATTIDQQQAVRAVAAANGANAISIIIPCHRVIGSKGDLVGYAGGLSVKHKLLELETRHPSLFN